jgi:hypothetical protein
VKPDRRRKHKGYQGLRLGISTVLGSYIFFYGAPQLKS